MAANAATRDVCLGVDGRPHTVGAALLRALGICPPGTVVRLANREVAVVVRRGERINAPLAVAIPAGARTEASALRLRDTAHAAFTIVGLAKSSEAPFIPGVGVRAHSGFRLKHVLALAFGLELHTLMLPRRWLSL